MKTKEQIAEYNKEYFARPEVIARAKQRNVKYRERRKEYKKTEQGRAAENKYKRGHYAKAGRSKHLWQRYKMTLSDYSEMLLSQNGRCAICSVKPTRRFHVDHCHETGRIRGLLCSNCNMALGLMKDRTDLLIKATEYLNAFCTDNSDQADSKADEEN